MNLQIITLLVTLAIKYRGLIPHIKDLIESIIAKSKDGWTAQEWMDLLTELIDFIAVIVPSDPNDPPRYGSADFPKLNKLMESTGHTLNDLHSIVKAEMVI